MKHRIPIILLLTLFFSGISIPSLIAQLKPTIGLYSIPADDDSVCLIPLAIDSGNIFMEPGLHEGDTIPDFKLYTLENDSVQLQNLITDGKPVLLVGGNYTCPKYRNHLDELNDLQSAYGSQVHIYIIYTVEAHPADPDISPYRGNVWELNSNEQIGIAYHEPVFYIDRKNTVSDMLNALNISVPVLLDGPCNEWWQTFALAPNPAFLIKPNGVIYKKQGWFDNGQYEMSNAIDSIIQELPTSIHDLRNNFMLVNDPASKVIQFIFSEPQWNTDIEFFDAMGRMVKSSISISGTTFTLDKEKFVTGIYLYAIHAGDQIFNGKLILQ